MYDPPDHGDDPDTDADPDAEPESPRSAPTPAALGYRLPAEWEPQAAMWLAWPHRRADWPGKFAPIPWVYGEIVRLLAASQPVRIVVRDRAQKKEAARVLEAAGVDREPRRVRFVVARTDRSWLRDILPSFVVRDNGNPLGDAAPVAAVAWRFNGWAKYPNHRRDARLAKKVARRLRIRRFKPVSPRPDGRARRVVLEGGALDTNGLGTLLTTTECLLSPDGVQVRNPGLTLAGYERAFADHLGITRTIWLDRGIVGDDTHGHVDDVARFVGPRTVVAAVEPNPDDPNHEILAANFERLRHAVDQDGRALEVVPLPMPRPVLFEGYRLPASYANFTIANGLVLVPTFNDPNDRVALDTLARVMPGRTVVGIHAVDLVLGLGTLHCLTREQPAAPGDEAENSHEEDEFEDGATPEGSEEADEPHPH